MAGVQGRFEDSSKSLLGSGSILKIRIAFLQTFFCVIHLAEGEISDFILCQPAKGASFGHQGIALTNPSFNGGCTGLSQLSIASVCHEDDIVAVQVGAGKGTYR